MYPMTDECPRGYERVQLWGGPFHGGVRQVPEGATQLVMRDVTEDGKLIGYPHYVFSRGDGRFVYVKSWAPGQLKGPPPPQYNPDEGW